MTTVTVDDPDEVKIGTIDDRGRLYVGSAFSGKEVRAVIEVLEDEG